MTRKALEWRLIKIIVVAAETNTNILGFESRSSFFTGENLNRSISGFKLLLDDLTEILYLSSNKSSNNTVICGLYDQVPFHLKKGWKSEQMVPMETYLIPRTSGSLSRKKARDPKVLKVSCRHQLTTWWHTDKTNSVSVIPNGDTNIAMRIRISVTR